MLRYIAKRLMVIPFIVLCVSALTFFVMHITPGESPVLILKYAFLGDIEAEPTIREIGVITERFGFNEPLYLQYLKWLNKALNGDLGISYVSDQPVIREILLRLPVTIELAVVSMLISLLISIPLGVISAVRQYSLIDKVGMMGALLGVSMPNFWLALLLILVFSLYLGWFPVFGYGSIEHIILPAVTIGTGTSAVTTRLMRSSMLEVLGQDYIITARAKGLREKVIITKHALKNALIPVTTVAGLQFAYLLEGAVIVETVFAWPGIGKLLIDSIFARDLMIIQGCVLFIAVMVVIVNLLVDILYVYMDPRIKYEGRA